VPVIVRNSKGIGHSLAWRDCLFGHYRPLDVIAQIVNHWPAIGQMSLRGDSRFSCPGAALLTVSAKADTSKFKAAYVIAHSPQRFTRNTLGWSFVQPSKLKLDRPQLPDSFVRKVRLSDDPFCNDKE
jgi:hypothetical protein